MITPLIAIALQLDRGRSVTTAQIATEYGVTQRTAQRWLQVIEQVLRLEREGNEYRVRGTM